MITKSENAMKYVKYVCAKCAAEDTGKYFQEEPVAPVINCWQCGSGRGLDVGQMLESHKGMFVQAQPA